MRQIINILDLIWKFITRRITMWRHHIGFFLVDKETIGDLRLPKLTKEEKKLISKTWPQLDISIFDYTWSRIWKREHGFSPYFIGTMWTWNILEVVNPFEQVVSLQNKALSDILFPKIKFPQAIIRKIGGQYYDALMKHISEREAVETLAERKQFVIKPAIDTLCGQGVKIIKKGECSSSQYQELILKALRESTENSISQELILQHTDISKLNPTSINSCRVTTIYLDGIMQSSTAMKIGKNGANKDNWNSSYFIGVNNDGSLMKYGYDNHIQRFERTDNGIAFNTISLPMYDKMVSTVQSWHKEYLPQCGIVGWDVLIDANNDVLVIEMNLTCPGIVAEQLTSGTFLEPFNEIINDKFLKKALSKSH